MTPIGTLLFQYFEKNRIRRASLARLMKINLDNLIKMEKKESIQTARLIELSTHLKHNFLMQLGEELNIPYETNAEKELKVQLQEKEKEIETLNTEISVYKKICKIDL